MMTQHEQYTPGPASGEVQKHGDQWTMILTRQLRHSPDKVWAALTDPAQLREWAPFDVDGGLDKTGNVNLTWMGSPQAMEIKVTRSEAPSVLEYDNTRWELEPSGAGTKLTLWQTIDKRFVCWGAAGWHISFDVLDSKLSGNPTKRIAGPEAMKNEGWQRLVGEYAQLFDAELPKWTPNAAKS